MNKQLEMELQFSKRMGDFLAIDSFINDTGDIMTSIGHIIDNWRTNEFWPEKQKLVNKLPETQDIVMELMLTMVTGITPQPIQGPAVELGSRLGYTNVVEAAKIGSSIIAEVAKMNDDLIHLVMYPDKTVVTSKLKLSPEALHKIKSLSYMPPNLMPAEWKTNYGGWKWEKKSVILGSGNHHNESQNLYALNILQKIPWTVDLDVVTNTNTNDVKLPHEWKEILGSYIGETFYFTYRYDKRGRIYSSGYQLNPQSNEFGKAMLSPKNGEVLTPEGNNELRKYYTNLVVDKKQILADKVRKALHAAWEEDREPETAIFMELDASQSGYQVMACLSNCMKTAKLCNLTSAPKQDLYQTILDRVEDRIGSHFGYTRKQVKKAIMTAAYNSMAKPAELFGEHVKDFWHVLHESCPGAMEVMDLINGCWNPHTLEHKWVMPDGHVVKVKVMEQADVRITIPELNDRKFTLIYNKNTPSKSGRSLVPNVIHSIDAYVCRMMIEKCHANGIEIAPIHDCFQFHPNNAEFVRKTYREIMAKIADPKYNLLNDICSQIIGRDAGIKINDEGLVQEILNSNYAIM